MAQHTKWSDWMAENLRYALSSNKKHPFKYTYSEYFYTRTPRNENELYAQGIIDIVGKARENDRLQDSIVIEIKSSISDINTGRGQNFVGKYNFFATDEAFADTLTDYSLNRYGENTVGVLVVRKDGSVDTVLPAFHKDKPMTIECDFADFSTDDEVEEYFKTVVIPRQRKLDANKPRSTKL